MYCVRAVRKVGYFGHTFPPMAEGTAVTDYRVPGHGTAQLLTQSKDSDDEVDRTAFHTENADCCLNLRVLPCGRHTATDRDPRRTGQLFLVHNLPGCRPHPPLLSYGLCLTGANGRG